MNNADKIYTKAFLFYSLASKYETKSTVQRLFKIAYTEDYKKGIEKAHEEYNFSNIEEKKLSGETRASCIERYMTIDRAIEVLNLPFLEEQLTLEILSQYVNPKIFDLKNKLINDSRTTSEEGYSTGLLDVLSAAKSKLTKLIKQKLESEQKPETKTDSEKRSETVDIVSPSDSLSEKPRRKKEPEPQITAPSNLDNSDSSSFDMLPLLSTLFFL